MSGVIIKGLAAAKRQMERHKKNMAYAAAQTVNYLATATRDAERKEMERVFDRPTRWTLNSTRVTYARRDNPVAVVWLKDEAYKGTPATKYLTPQIYGERRGQKRFEKSLQNAGVLPVGWKVVPGEGAKIDQYGNMSRGQINEILAWFQAFHEMGFRANTTAAGKARRGHSTKSRYGYGYFAANKWDPRTKHLQPGVYRRIKSNFGYAIVPVMIFVPSAKYSKRYAFFDVADRVRRNSMNKAIEFGNKRAFG